MLTLKEAKEWKSSLSASITEMPQWEMISDDQLVAIAAICCSKYDCVSLLGRAGSGKTFVVKFARTILKLLGCEVRVTASTGVAAKNAGGEGTINRIACIGANGSTLPMGLFDVVPAGHSKRSDSSKRAKDAQANFDLCKKNELVIFIDEFSMLTSEDLVVIYETIKRCSSNRKVRFVLTGDPRQLLFVLDNKAEHWTTYGSLAFDPAKFQPAGSTELQQYGSMMGSGPFPQGREQPWNSIVISLINNHRQKEADGWFVTALGALGDGHNFNHPDVKRLLNRVWVEGKGNFKTKEPLPDLKYAIHLFNRNADVATHNDEMLEEAIQQGKEVREYETVIYPNSWSRSEILGEISPLGEKVKLAVGLKFMVRVNINADLTNGTVGEIVKLEENRVQIRLASGDTHWVDKVEIPLPKDKYGNPVGRVVAIPGILAHAMTPWKAQGLTFDEPMVYHLNQWYPTHGLMNVVVSRVTKPEHLFIEVSDLKMLNKSILCQKEVFQFIQRAENNMLVCLGKAEPEDFLETEEGFFMLPHWSLQQRHRVKVVEFVKSPKGEVIEDNDILTIYHLPDVGYGAFIKNKRELRSLLTENKEGEEWFASQVKFVWFAN
jgi:hypothetical protein